MSDSIKVFAPATVANVTCGFDILGFAVDQPGDEITLQKSNTGQVKIIRITGDGGGVHGETTISLLLSAPFGAL